jgi:hypothetical protein
MQSFLKGRVAPGKMILPSPQVTAKNNLINDHTMPTSEQLFELIAQAQDGFPYEEVLRLGAIPHLNALLRSRRITCDPINERYYVRSPDDDTQSTKTDYRESITDNLVEIGRLERENKKLKHKQDVVLRTLEKRDAEGEEMGRHLAEAAASNEELGRQLVEANAANEELDRKLVKANAENERLVEFRAKLLDMESQNYSFIMIHVLLFVIILMLSFGLGWFDWLVGRGGCVDPADRIW